MPILDHDLRAGVLQALASDPRTTSLNLRVGVLNAIVHLGGEVPDAGTRLQAERVAARVEGVRGVVNRIHAPGAPSPGRTINLTLE